MFLRLEEKKLRWWPLPTFVWTLLGVSIFVQVLIQSPLGVCRSAQYTLWMVGTSMIVTHLLSDVFLPVLIKRRQMVRFVLLGLAACFLTGFLFALIDYQFNPDQGAFIIKWFSMMTSAIVITGTICGLRFYREHAAIAQEHQQLQTAHLEAELKLLRDQVNPHFLFNVMNSIHVLMKKDVHQASAVLLKFSDMLRHQLYDSSKAFIPLAEEINYLKNYVNVEMIRWGGDVEATCQWPELTYHPQIAPFLLSPFIENAFKYVSRDREEGNFVHISVTMQEHQLQLLVENTFDDNQHPAGLPKAGGIGLENVQKRLQLIYPNRHQLKIEKENQLFKVTLSIQLSEV